MFCLLFAFISAIVLLIVIAGADGKLVQDFIMQFCMPECRLDVAKHINGHWQLRDNQKAALQKVNEPRLVPPRRRVVGYDFGDR